MIVERSLHPQFSSNTYLVAAEEGGSAFIVDAGGPVQPLIEVAERLTLTPTHLLLTHHHYDHVCETSALLQRWPSLEVLIHPSERELLADVETTGTIEAGHQLKAGGLRIRPLHTPGHTLGMLSFLVDGDRSAVFTGDTLFKGSVGGVHAPGHTTYIDLKDAIMGTLMELPPSTVIYPGHTDASTVAEEWEHNPFVRLWRKEDREGAEPCIALGKPATLVLRCPDYDGGTKAWVRWPDGEDDIVPGSQVQPA